MLGSAKAQTLFEFTDSLAASWMGDREKFSSNGQLQSASLEENDTFVLFTDILASEEWSMDLELKFNTSSANYVDWVLNSSHAELNDSSLYIRIGGSKDDLRLYRGAELLIDGEDKVTEKCDFQLKVVLVNDRLGLYRIEQDSTVLEGVYQLAHPLNWAYTGISIRQSTSSFHQKHFIDNYYYGPLRRDTQAPKIEDLQFDPLKIVLGFSEPLIASDSAFIMLNSDTVSYVQTQPHELLIATNFQENGNYILKVAGFADTAGNKMRDSLLTMHYYFGKTPSADLIFNEILFNPVDDGVDYIELYNRGEELLQLADLQLCRFVDGERRDFKTLDSFLLQPGNFLVISSDSNKVREQFQAHGSLWLNMSTPAMNNASGILLLLDSAGLVLDSISYHEDMHFELLATVDGVSLERVQYAGPSWDQNLWQSAAYTVGFGSPGLANSQFQAGLSESFEFEYDVVSPNGDGFQDILILRYAFDKPGYQINVRVFDLNGVLVARPENLITASTEGMLSWDLVKSNGARLEVGTYVYYLEAVHSDGVVVRQKLAFGVH